MTVVVSPPASSIATAEALQLDIFVDSASWEGQFDSLEVWRSRLGEGGPYEPLTGDGWAPARLPIGVLGDAPNPPQTGPSAALSGRPLFLKVHEKTSLSIVFSGIDPLSFAAAASQIQAGSAGLLQAFVLSNHVVIQTVQPGAGAVVRVVGGDAAPLLGLLTVEPGSVAFGTDARVRLVHNVSSYLFTDLNGSKDFFYKTRFYNSLTRTTSDFGIPFQGKFISAVSPQNVARGILDLVDAHGKPVYGQKVLVYNRFKGVTVESKTLVGGPLDASTDENGHVEFLLVRGAQLTVAIPGTDLVRDLVVPTDPTIQTFNLLDPSLTKDDVFNVQIPNLDFAVRRSL